MGQGGVWSPKHQGDEDDTAGLRGVVGENRWEDEA